MTKTIIIGRRNGELEKGGLELLYKFQVAATGYSFQLKAGPFKLRQTFKKIKQRKNLGNFDVKFKHDLV